MLIADLKQQKESAISICYPKTKPIIQISFPKLLYVNESKYRNSVEFIKTDLNKNTQISFVFLGSCAFNC